MAKKKLTKEQLGYVYAEKERKQGERASGQQIPRERKTRNKSQGEGIQRSGIGNMPF